MSPFFMALFGFITGAILTYFYASTYYQATIAQLAHTLTTQKEVHAQTLSEHTDLLQAHATLQAHHQHLKEKLQDQQHAITQLQDQFTLQFKSIAEKLLEEKSQKFTQQNQTQLTQLLTPLSEKITAFEKQVAATNKESLARNVALRTELKHLHALNTRITQEAHNLTQAIKGDVKAQGNWGELILEKLLETAGLTAGREYTVQNSYTTATGKRYRPDIILHLPNGKHIIIDAKTSLLHYEQYANAVDQPLRKEYLKKHLLSLRNHIKNLDLKNYAHTYKQATLDFVLMFIPLEAAFSLALQHAPSLYQEAYAKNIIIASPSTTLGTLRMLHYMWQQDHQNRYALDIAKQSGALYDKFVNFVTDLNKLGKQLDTTQKTYLSATKKLYDGRSSLVEQAEKIRRLGARTSKTLQLGQ